MKKSSSRQSKKLVKAKYDIDLEEFGVGYDDILKEVVEREKRKVVSKYELEKIVENERSIPSFVHRKSSLIPVSPHLVDLKKKLANHKKRIEDQKIAEQAKGKMAANVIQVKDNIKSANTQLRASTLRHVSRIANLGTQFQREVSFHNAVLSKLSLLQLIFSTLKIIDHIVNYLYGFLIESKEQAARFKVKVTDSKVVGFSSGRLVFAKFIIFFLVAVLLLTPFGLLNVYQKAMQDKGRVLGMSFEATEFWQDGAKHINNGEWTEAADSFKQAGNTFQKAKAELESYNQILLSAAKYVPGQGSDIRSGTNLIELGDKLSVLVSELSNIIADHDIISEQTLIEQLDLFSTQIDYIHTSYQEISPLLAEIDYEILPDAYQVLFLTWQENNKYFVSLLGDLNQTLTWLQKVLGNDRPQRYLLVFQNSNELRATGGFMGSFALMDINDGIIESIDLPGGGLYDLGGQLKEFVIAPYPHQLLGSRWQIWDANWWPDWPMTAQKISWFYEKTGGPSVDGIFAINSRVIKDLVEIFGPIELPDYNKTLTHLNVVTALQHAVEFEYDREENKPKQILADLLPILIQKMYSLESEQLLEFGSMISTQLREGDIQLYFEDDVMNSFVEQKDWSGSISQTDGDYLNVVAQNIGGGKTDHVIEQNIDYQLTVGPDKYLIAKASISRKHNGDIEDVFTRHRNVSFIRIYVPLGSELISIEGAIEPDQKLFSEMYDNLEADVDLIELDGLSYYTKFDKYYDVEQFGKQVYGQWLMVDPGEEQKLEFIYRLPIKITEKETSRMFKWFSEERNELTYSLYLEKQSGLLNSNFSMKFEIPRSMDIKWFNDSSQKMYKLGNWLYTEDNSREDYVLGFIAQ